jgi:hypothetical protein
MEPTPRGSRFPFAIVWSAARRALPVLSLLSLAVLPWPASARPGQSDAVQVNLGPIIAADENMARVVREILLTDLAKSPRLSVLDLDETSAERGRMPANTWTGSCLVLQDRVYINLRMLDGDGRTVPGAAVNAEGASSTLMAVVRGVAENMSSRLTGTARAASPLPAPAKKPAPKAAASSSGRKPLLPNPGQAAGKAAGAAASTAGRIFKPRVVVPMDPDRTERADRPERAESRPPSRSTEETNETSDADDVVEEPAPRRTAGRDRDGERPAAPAARGPKYTSVIIDARGLGLDRSMSPSIRREDGTVIWNGAGVDPDFVISDGIVTYATTMSQALRDARAGEHPLTLEAIDSEDRPFPSDCVLSDEDADYLLQAAKRSDFLKKYRVIFVVGR